MSKNTILSFLRSKKIYLLAALIFVGVIIHIQRINDLVAARAFHDHTVIGQRGRGVFLGKLGLGDGINNSELDPFAGISVVEQKLTELQIDIAVSAQPVDGYVLGKTLGERDGIVGGLGHGVLRGVEQGEIAREMINADADCREQDKGDGGRDECGRIMVHF